MPISSISEGGILDDIDGGLVSLDSRQSPRYKDRLSRRQSSQSLDNGVSKFLALQVPHLLICVIVRLVLTFEHIVT